MVDVTVVNGSPKMEKGNTGFLLAPFMAGMQKAGTDIHLVYTSQLQIDPCSCGRMLCWSRTPGICIHKDEMSDLYHTLKQSDILVIATPVYTPLPGAMQEFINRLCPLMDPRLRFEDGRVKAQFREDVKIAKIGLLVTSGWWELENTENVVKIIHDLASLVGVEFLPPILRPHVGYMRAMSGTSDRAKEILGLLEIAGEQLIRIGTIDPEITKTIRQPLVTLEKFLESWQ